MAENKPKKDPLLDDGAQAVGEQKEPKPKPNTPVPTIDTRKPFAVVAYMVGERSKMETVYGKDYEAAFSAASELANEIACGGKTAYVLRPAACFEEPERVAKVKELT